ncbi:MAG TPA: hypothetical protein VN958_18995 [Chitinophagaceae bacterium]|nr:hypothetical protein [Chitinophagaceae bacterium]
MQSKLKEEIHRMIDEIEDEAALMLIKEKLAAYVTEDIAEDLNEEQLKELNEALKEAGKGETVSYEKYVSHVKEWKRKLSS